MTNLKDYLNQNKISVREFSERIHVDASTVCRYLNRSRIPEEEVMVRIYEQTNGEVEPNDFYSL